MYSRIDSDIPSPFLSLSQEFRDKAALLADAKRTNQEESKSSAARNGAAFHSDDEEEVNLPYPIHTYIHTLIKPVP